MGMLPQPFRGLMNITWLILPLIFLGLSIVAICLTKDKEMRMKRLIFPFLAIVMSAVTFYSALSTPFPGDKDIIIDIPDSDVKLVAKENGAYSCIYIKKAVGKELVACVEGGKREYRYFKEGTYEVINNGDNTVTVILRDPITKREYIETFEIE